MKKLTDAEIKAKYKKIEAKAEVIDRCSETLKREILKRFKTF